MKKALLTMMCLFAMMATSRSIMAQEVTITLTPGWSWIGFPGTDTLDLATAFGSFTPMEGDVIKSKNAVSSYISYGSYNMWYGTLNTLEPGKGYMYKSNRTEPVTLTFQVQPSTSQVVVTTSEPTDITAASVVVGGTVTLPEGSHIFLSGVCWGTDQMPTVDDNHTSDGSGTNDFTTSLMGLTSNTTYYVRAYVVTDFGLAYGEERSFTTLDYSGNVPEGAIDGLFSVSATQQVYFSQGNLQYKAIDSLWRFAENQFDYIGDANSHISQFYDGWIDLFGWGTSGFDHGANCYQPWSRSSNYVDYYAYGSWNKNLSDQSGQADWGCNAISNGGNQENQWRTLSQSEWNYVLFGRNTTSGIRFAKATIRELIIDTISNDTVFNNVHGIVLLPDNWSESAYILNDANVSGAPYETNIILDNMWQYIETVGAVFLPAAGTRNGFSNVLYANSYGYYWSTTYDDSRYACFLSFSDHFVYSNDSFYRFFGRSVRLVSNAE